MNILRDFPLFHRWVSERKVADVTRNHLDSEDFSTYLSASGSSSLLGRQGYLVLLIAIASYILLQGLTSINSICNYSRPYSDWTYNYYFAAGFSFFVSAIQQLSKICELFNRRGGIHHDRAVTSLAAASIGLIAGSSSVLTSNYDFGGVCVDALGVESPAAQWSEWLVCVPLMVYIAIAVEDKPQLSRSDVAVIVLMLLSVFFGMIMNIHMSFELAVVFFILGSLCLLSAFFLVYGIKPGSIQKENAQVADESCLDVERGRGVVDSAAETEKKVTVAMATKKRTLITLVILIFPIFPIVYLLGVARTLDRDQVAVAYVIVSIASKLLFVSFLIDVQDGHFDVLEKKRIAAKFANDTRRAFLRYVFHELRIPLSTVSMGISLIQHDEGSKRWEEALKMMNAAATFMGDTLNDVLFVDSAADGTMKLSKQAFNFDGLLARVIKSQQSNFEEQGVTIGMETYLGDNPASDVGILNHLLLGDEVRMSNVLESFLVNSVSLSDRGSKITIKVTKNFTKVKRLKPVSRKMSVLRLVSNVEGDAAGGRNQSNSQDGENTSDKNPIIAAARSLMGPKSADLRDAIASKPISPRLSSVEVDGKDTPVAPTYICHLTVQVISKGPGLKREDLEGLLKPYSQIRPEKKDDDGDQGRSTGLWLVIAKRIITMHNGSLIADSTEGVGTTFGFRIPFDVVLSNDPSPALKQVSVNSFDELRSRSSVVSNLPPLRSSKKTTFRSRDGKSGKSGRGSIKGRGKGPRLEGIVDGEKEDEHSRDEEGRLAESVHGDEHGGPDGDGLNENSAVVRRKSEKRARSNGQLAVGLDDKRKASQSDRPPKNTSTNTSACVPSTSQSQSQSRSRSQPLSPIRSIEAERNKDKGRDEGNIINTPQKFLVVDDTPSNNKMLRMLLKGRRIDCDFAENGQEAVEAVAKNGDSYQLIFMDFTMPILNGAEASRAIRQDGFPRLIIGLTGNALDDDVTTFLEAGADCVTPKPLRAAQLDAIIRHVIEEGFESLPLQKFTVETLADGKCEFRSLNFNKK